MYSALWSLVKPSLFALFLSSFYPPLLSISLSSSFLPFVILLLLCMWKHPPKSNFQLALSPLQSADKSRPCTSHTRLFHQTQRHTKTADPHVSLQSTYDVSSPPSLSRFIHFCPSIFLFASAFYHVLNSDEVQVLGALNPQPEHELMCVRRIFLA